MPINPYQKGNKGTKGSDGESAYQAWLDIGNTGTKTQFLESLVGAEGEQGPAGPVGPAGLTWKGEYDDDTTYDKDDAVGYEGATYFSLTSTTGVAPLPENDDWALMAAYGERGEKGADGDSAYQIWVDAGNEGTEEVFLASLVGENGTNGTNGTDGADGSNGKDGIGISSTTITYQISSSGTTTPTGTWSSTLPSIVKGKYLWSKILLTYSNSTTATVYSCAYSGTDGGTSTTYFGISPASGYYTKHQLGDSGLYFIMKGTGSYDVGQGIYDANSPRVIGYRYVSLWGGSGVDGYYNQAYTTTSSPYLFDGTSYWNAQENTLAFITDTTTGRVWKVEKWGMSRTSGRYFCQITELTSGTTQTYTDYSSTTV